MIPSGPGGARNKAGRGSPIPGEDHEISVIYIESRGNSTRPSSSARAGLAAELEQAFGADVKLVKGSGGVFDVVVDGRKVFSKYETGRFPEPDEVVSLLGQRTG